MTRKGMEKSYIFRGEGGGTLVLTETPNRLGILVEARGLVELSKDQFDALCGLNCYGGLEVHSPSAQAQEAETLIQAIKNSPDVPMIPHPSPFSAEDIGRVPGEDF